MLIQSNLLHNTVPVDSNNKYYSLDGLRGISILIVILSHFNHYWNNKFIYLLVGAGIVGVYIFFVLSGFLITTLLLKERDKNFQRINLKNFYIRRILRIVPLSWLYILIIFLITSLIKTKIEYDSFLVAGLYVVNISSIFSVPYLFVHYWSLSAEEQFYLLIPPILKFSQKLFIPTLILILISTFLFRFLANRFTDSTIIQILADISRNLDGLVIGSIYAILLYKNRLPILKILKYKNLLNIILLPLLLILNQETSILIFKFFANHTFYSFLIGILIIINLYPTNDFYFKLLNSKFLTYLGVLSYSLYIWQQLFSSGMIPLPSYLNLLLLIVTAHLSYNYFEKPFLRIKSKYSLV